MAAIVFLGCQDKSIISRMKQSLTYGTQASSRASQIHSAGSKQGIFYFIGTVERFFGRCQVVGKFGKEGRFLLGPRAACAYTYTSI